MGTPFYCLILKGFFLIFKDLSNTYAYDLWINSLQREPPLNHLHFVVSVCVYGSVWIISQSRIILFALFYLFDFSFIFS